MKIVNDDCVYVQKKDICFLKSLNIFIPSSILDKANVSNNLSMDDNYFIKFTDRSDMDYFISLDFILDYNKMRDISEDKLNVLMEDALSEQDDINFILSNVDEAERNQYDDLILRSKILEYKLDSLDFWSSFNQGYSLREIPYYNDKKKVKYNIKSLIRRAFNRNDRFKCV